MAKRADLHLDIFNLPVVLPVCFVEFHTTPHAVRELGGPHKPHRAHPCVGQVSDGFTGDFSVMRSVRLSKLVTTWFYCRSRRPHAVQNKRIGSSYTEAQGSIWNGNFSPLQTLATTPRFDKQSTALG